MQRPSFALLMLCGALALGLTAADRTNRPAVKGKGRMRAAVRTLEPIRSKPQTASTLATSFVVALPAVESPAVESPASESPIVESPIVESPVVESPVVESPASELPVAESPAVVTLEAEAPEPAPAISQMPSPIDTPSATDTSSATNTPASIDMPVPTSTVTVSDAPTVETMDVPVEQVDAATETARLPVPPTDNLIPHWLTTGEVDPVDTLTDQQADTAVESVSDAPVEVPVETVGPPSTSWEPVEVAAQRVALRAATSLDRVAMLFQRLAESLRVSAKEATNPSAIHPSPPQAGG